MTVIRILDLPSCTVGGLIAVAKIPDSNKLAPTFIACLVSPIIKGKIGVSEFPISICRDFNPAAKRSLLCQSLCLLAESVSTISIAAIDAAQTAGGSAVL